MSALRHLSESDLVDLLDARADPAREAHAASCPSCAARLDSLQATLALVASDEAPEPSPLFWPHLSSHVHGAVRAEAETRRQWRTWRWAFAAAPALVVLFALALVWRPAPTSAPAQDGASARAGMPAAGTAEIGPVVPADDEVTWELVALLSGSPGEESEPEIFAPRLGAAERVIYQLMPEEQEALIRLLEEELGGGPS